MSEDDEKNTQGPVIGEVGTAGGKFVARDDNNRQQNLYFNNSDNAIIWSKLMELVVSLDDLPNRVGKLEVIVKPATRFERMIIAILAVVVVILFVVGGVVFYLWIH